MSLLQRIDLALKEAGLTRHQLAVALGITTQAISNLRRRPGALLKPAHIAKAARFMRCDIYWLCTGEPEHYMPESTRTVYSWMATEIANFIEGLDEADKARAYAVVHQMSKGVWPPMDYLQQPPRPAAPSPKRK